MRLELGFGFFCRTTVRWNKTKQKLQALKVLWVQGTPILKFKTTTIISFLDHNSDFKGEGKKIFAKLGKFHHFHRFTCQLIQINLNLQLMDRLSTRTIDALYFVHQFLRPYFFFPLKQPGYEKGSVPVNGANLFHIFCSQQVR